MPALRRAKREVLRIVTDIDLRYQAKTGADPVPTRSRLVGDTVEVQLTDTDARADDARVLPYDGRGLTAGGGGA